MRIRILIVLAAAALIFAPTGGIAAARVNKEFTIVAGTPRNVATEVTTAVITDIPYLVTRIFIQMKTAGTGLGYVMADVPRGTVGSQSNTKHKTAELAPATATAPGASYSDTDPGGIDISLMWIDGSVSGDKVIISYVPKT